MSESDSLRAGGVSVISRAAGGSGGAAALRTVAAQMLDGDGVVPRNVGSGKAKDGGEGLALPGAGDVIAADNRFDQFRVQPAAAHQLRDGDTTFFHHSRYGLHYGGMLSLSWAPEKWESSPQFSR